MTLPRNAVVMLSGVALVAAPLGACSDSSDSNEPDASVSASVSSSSEPGSSSEPSASSSTSSEPLRDSDGNIVTMTGPGTQLAFGEPAVLQMQTAAGNTWTGKITVNALENPGPEEYEIHDLNPDETTLYYVRYSAEMLKSSAADAVLITPGQLYPDFAKGSAVEYNITSMGSCTSEDAYLAKPGDSVEGCLVFEQTAGEETQSVIAVPQGVVPFATWSDK